jgi:glycosyltransferase involved in cell wall biosynthesis
MSVIVSNGFSKFHLATAAAEAADRQLLARFLTGAYPSPRLTRLARAHRLPAKLARLASRAESVPDGRVVALWRPEVVHQVAMTAIEHPVAGRTAERVARTALRRYGRAAARHVRRCRSARVYHYRAGFGWESVEVANQLGMVTLCDHSIAHPALVDHLVAHGGALPSQPVSAPQGLWGDILVDIERSRHVLVNSAFVRDTFLAQGFDPSRIHVIYWGVDDAFLSAVPGREAPSTGPLRLAFAGHFARRKGAETIAAALADLDDVDWSLEVIGPVDRAGPYGAFLHDPRVRTVGTLSREALAARLSHNEVLVFPSLAEGSARVVFEAMACGCHVITTPNAGSVVEEGVHGRLVAPDDPEALREAIRSVAADRARVAAVGSSNAELVRRSYTQAHYGQALAALYGRLTEVAA